MTDATTLLALSPGQSGIVLGYSGGRGLASRLAAMGFVPGAEVTIVNNYRGGPILVLVHGSRIALGRGEAAHVSVRPLAPVAAPKA
jgi:ferrous iron transport protein A